MMVLMSGISGKRPQMPVFGAKLESHEVYQLGRVLERACLQLAVDDVGPDSDLCRVIRTEPETLLDRWLQKWEIWRDEKRIAARQRAIIRANQTRPADDQKRLYSIQWFKFQSGENVNTRLAALAAEKDAYGEPRYRVVHASEGDNRFFDIVTFEFPKAESPSEITEDIATLPV